MSLVLNPLQSTRVATPDSAHSFLVGQDGDGHWVAVETGGSAGGLFRTRQDAIRYACIETGCRPADVPVAAGPIRFRLT